MYSDNNSAKRRFAGSYVISLMSIMLVLFVIGMYAAVAVYTDGLLDYVKENIGFEVVIKGDAKESSITSLKNNLEKKNYIKSIEYISKEDATQRMKDDLGEDFLKWLGDIENPLLPSLDMRFVADYANSDSMAKIEKELYKNPIVKEVIYQKSLTDTINVNIEKIKVILFVMSLVFILIAITLIGHTIRLAIYSKRFTVRTMQLVGATEAFVIKPFLKTFVIQGLIAAFIAVLLITVSLYGIRDFLPDMGISQYNYLIIIYLFVFILSLLLSGISTVISVKKYLNADLDKLYI